MKGTHISLLATHALQQGIAANEPGMIAAYDQIVAAGEHALLRAAQGWTNVIYYIIGGPIPGRRVACFDTNADPDAVPRAAFVAAFSNGDPAYLELWERLSTAEREELAKELLLVAVAMVAKRELGEKP